MRVRLQFTMRIILRGLFVLLGMRWTRRTWITKRSSRGARDFGVMEAILCDPLPPGSKWRSRARFPLTPWKIFAKMMSSCWGSKAVNEFPLPEWTVKTSASRSRARETDFSNPEQEFLSSARSLFLHRRISVNSGPLCGWGASKGRSHLERSRARRSGCGFRFLAT